MSVYRFKHENLRHYYLRHNMIEYGAHTHTHPDTPTPPHTGTHTGLGLWFSSLNGDGMALCTMAMILSLLISTLLPEHYIYAL